MNASDFDWLQLPPGPSSVRESKRELSALESDVTHTAPLMHDRYSQAEWNLFFLVRHPVTLPAPDCYESWPDDRHVLLYCGLE